MIKTFILYTVNPGILKASHFQFHFNPWRDLCDKFDTYSTIANNFYFIALSIIIMKLIKLCHGSVSINKEKKMKKEIRPGREINFGRRSKN